MKPAIIYRAHTHLYTHTHQHAHTHRLQELKSQPFHRSVCVGSLSPQISLFMPCFMCCHCSCRRRHHIFKCQLRRTFTHALILPAIACGRVCTRAYSQRKREIERDRAREREREIDTDADTDIGTHTPPHKIAWMYKCNGEHL